MSSRPEIANSIQTGSFTSNYHDYGEGDPVVFIHGSGPGVSAWANWRGILPIVSRTRRALALDMVGFGYTERPEGIQYSLDVWAEQAINFLDAMKLDKVDLVGNSFGGALAMAVAILYPERVRKLVLMGSMGVKFDLSYGLNEVWGYQPSPEKMLDILNLFVYNKALATPDLAKLRYEGSIQPGFQEAFGSMFPYPRQSSVDAMAKYEDRIKYIQQPTLIVHGRDDKVIPLETSYKIFSYLENARLHIFGQCGHWTQIEHGEEFAHLVDTFLAHS